MEVHAIADVRDYFMTSVITSIDRPSSSYWGVDETAPSQEVPTYPFEAHMHGFLT